MAEAEGPDPWRIWACLFRPIGPIRIIAAIIVFMSLAQEWQSKRVIVGLILGILLLDLLVMPFAEPVQHGPGMPLMVFGSVPEMVQAALGLHIMLIALPALGVVSGPPRPLPRRGEAA
jgi:hypothetical protein